jgi:hypothetical protein
MGIINIPKITIDFFYLFFLYLSSAGIALAVANSERGISKQELNECNERREFVFGFFIGISVAMKTFHVVKSKLHPASLMLKRAKE